MNSLKSKTHESFRLWLFLAEAGPSWSFSSEIDKILSSILIFFIDLVLFSFLLSVKYLKTMIRLETDNNLER